MLKLTLLPEEYLTIDSEIVVQLKRIAGGRADIAVDAPREFPIVRGAVLEKNGGKRPACLAPAQGRKTRYFRDQVYRWNDDKERAVRVMRQVLDRLERDGAGDEVKLLRLQLDRIVPTFWDEDLAAK